MKGLKLKFNYWGKRIFFFSFLIFLILLVFFFKMPEIKLFGFSVINPFYNLIINVKWWLYLLIYFNIVFVINSIVFILMTIILRKSRIKSEKREKQNEQFIVNKVIEIIYSNNNNSSKVEQNKIDEILSIAQQYHSKLILLNTLKKIHAQAKDEVRLKTIDIFEKLNFDDIIKMNLHSPYFRDKIFAMKIIAEFQLGMKNVYDFENNEFHDYIIKLTKKKNYVLRTEAFVSLIKLAMQDDLSFLLDSEIHVSLWDMNIVINIFKELKNNNINYQLLIESKTPRIATLGIILAHQHHKTEFKNLILSKIGDEDDLLNFEAYAAYISMVDKESDYHFLIEKFYKEKPIIKREIVKAFADCNSKTIAINFLNKVIEEENLILKVEAMKILIVLNFSIINELKNSKNIDIIKARNQILDFNLN